MEDLSVRTIVATLGFLVGIIFGATVQRTNFCTMGGVSDMILMGDTRRIRAWFLAIAVAIIGTQAMHVMGLIDINESIYLTTNFGWAGAIIGGLMFGFGMTFAGGCANKNLVRLGGGNMKSLVVVLVMGIFAYMTLRGLVGLARVQMESVTNVELADTLGVSSQGIIDLLAVMIGSEVESLRVAVTAVIAGLILFWCFKSADFRGSRTDIAAGLIIGALIPAGWYITGVVGYDDFEPTQLFSFTFVSPAGESLQYLMTFTGASINFGIATVGGVIVGSFLMAVATKSFHIEAFSGADDMKKQMGGASLMGIGGILALGCTVGQGITGMSSLAVGSVLALSSIILGAVIGLKYMEEGTLGGAIKAAFVRG